MKLSAVNVTAAHTYSLNMCYAFGTRLDHTSILQYGRRRKRFQLIAKKTRNRGYLRPVKHTAETGWSRMV